MNELKPIKIVAMGQSLASGLFLSYETGSNIGVESLQHQFQSGAQVPVQVENKSVPGTSLLRKYRPRRSWWDEHANQPGRMLSKALAGCAEADVILWSQGERDAEDPDLDLGVYEGALRKLFLFLRKTYGCFIICNFIGRRVDGHDETTQQIYQIQRKLTDELNFIFAAAEQYHVNLCDDIHPDDAGFNQIGALVGQSIAAACLEFDDPYPTVTKVTAKKNIVAFYLDGPKNWALNGKHITSACQISPESGESQFTVISDRAGMLVSEEMYFDPNNKEVFLVFDEGVLEPSDVLLAYVAYGSCSSLKQEYLITDCSIPKRPIRRCAFQVTVARD